MSPRPNVEELRREEILQAACAVVAERGYASARVADIAERSGTSSATVHYYFKTKENVLTEALAFAGRRAWAEHRAHLARLPRPTDRLLRLVDWQVPSGPGRDDWMLWLEVWNEAARRADVREAQQAAYDEWLRTLEGVIDAGVSAGEFREVEPKAAAATLAALIDGLALQVISGRRLTPSGMRRLVRRHLERDILRSGAGTGSAPS
ncbi:MAG: TetR/AcrR family transcriptional regulator [Acidimicrobiales bacterium]